MSQDRKDIIWIASYPKSGNTWLRFLACNLLFGRQDSASALNVLVPDIHELGRTLIESTHKGLVKTHFLCSPTLPLLERTAAAIYVVRHPADVLDSNFHYAQRRSAPRGDAERAFDDYYEMFLQHGGDPRWTQLGMGGWNDNVRSWIDIRHPFPVLTVRYEDMSADPMRVARVLAQLLRPTLSASDILLAVEGSSFARMQEIEQADIANRRVGIFYKPYLQPAIEAGRRFMHRGTAGHGVSRLNPQQRSRLDAAFGPLMRALGY